MIEELLNNFCSDGQEVVVARMYEYSLGSYSLSVIAQGPLNIMNSPVFSVGNVSFNVNVVHSVDITIDTITIKLLPK